MNRYLSAGDPVPAFTRLPTMQPMTPPRPTSAEGLGVVYGPVLERFWLRRTPTFNRVGSEYPAGTKIAILDRVEKRSGRFGLYRVAVGYVSQGSPAVDYGWAALSAADVASVLGSGTNAALLRSYGRSMDGKLDPLPPE